MACINRTTNQLNESMYHVYPISTPINYKKDNGEYDTIDLSFEDSTSKIGDISLNRKNVFSTGIRKDKNPNKFVGIRPDNCQDGSKQIEISINSVEINGDSNYDIDNFFVDINSFSFFQLYKNTGFKDFKIEFKIDLKGVSIENDKYTETTKIRNSLKTEFIDLGQDTGANILNRYANDSDITESDSYLRVYYGQITDEFIARFGYTNEEEFGDADVSNYSFYDMGIDGSSTYLKDAIVFYIHSKDIDDVESSILRNLCNKYELSLEGNEEDTGRYFFKDGKKVGGYFNEGNKFLGYFNTKEIPEDIKSLFIRKDFDDTSYISLTQSQFDIDMKDQFNYDVDSIEVGTDYYKGSAFQIKIANNSYWIDEPKIMDSNKEFISEYGDLTHTLKDNGDGSYTYTKYLTIKGLLRNLGHSENYIDVNINSNVNDMLSSHGIYSSTNYSTTFSQTGLTSIRNAATGTGAGYHTTAVYAGVSKSTNNPQSGSHRSTFSYSQRHMHFDVSAVSDCTSAKMSQNRIYKPEQTGSTNTYAGIKFYWCKSTNTEDTYSTANVQAAWNDLTGFNSSGWAGSDLTEYSSEIAVTNTTTTAGATHQQDTLNSDAISDINANSSFSLACIEAEEYYAGSLNTGETIPDVKNKKNKKWVYACHTVGNSTQDTSMGITITTADLTYLEIDGETAATPTDNATFFGANF